MWELDCEEGWAPKIDAFELWCWKRLLRVPWTAKRSTQSILKEISPGISLEGMMLKLKLQYSGHLMRRVDLLEKTLMLGGIGGRRKGDDRGWDSWMASLTRWTWVWVSSGSWWWTGRPGVLRFIGSQRVGHDWATDLIWSDLNSNYKINSKIVKSLPWGRKWQPPPVFLPGKLHGQKNLAGYSPWGSQRFRHDWASMQCHQNLYMKIQELDWDLCNCHIYF